MQRAFPPLQNRVPSVKDHVESIQSWIIHHLLVTARSAPRYENYLYGPVNALLGAIFPATQRYMITPQGLIRKLLSDEEVEALGEDAANVSIGSTGGLHQSRALPGFEPSKKFPDFLVVKVTPQANERDHHIVSMVEVKRERSGPDDLRQMRDYMRQAYALPNKVERLQGYLISANYVIKFTMEPKGSLVELTNGEPVRMVGRTDTYIKELCRLAVDHWNYQASRD